MRGRLQACCPGRFFLDPERPEELQAWLERRQLLARGEPLSSLSAAGEGNMNLVLRAVSASGAQIVKQARPWVERYPQYQAPDTRVLVEGRFWQLLAGTRAASMGPHIAHLDRQDRVMVMEDLGAGQDYSHLYAGGALPESVLVQLLGFLEQVHGLQVDPEPLLENREMRALNHAHIFDLPMQGGVIDLEALTPGLEAAAQELRAHQDYSERVAALGRRFLSDGAHLVHGDFFPGAWLQTERGVAVIDAEFCFLGEPAFDHGVLAGHLILARQDEAFVERVFSATGQPQLARQYAGVEVMRRLIGLAQLPLVRSLEQKRALLERSLVLVRS